MNNDWLKAKVREELEVEYIKKLDELVKFYEKRMEESNQQAWDIIQNQSQKFEEKLLEYKRFVRNTILGIVDGILAYDSEREFVRKKINEALDMGENV